MNLKQAIEAAMNEAKEARREAGLPEPEPSPTHCWCCGTKLVYGQIYATKQAPLTSGDDEIATCSEVIFGMKCPKCETDATGQP